MLRKHLQTGKKGSQEEKPTTAFEQPFKHLPHLLLALLGCLLQEGEEWSGRHQSGTSRNGAANAASGLATASSANRDNIPPSPIPRLIIPPWILDLEKRKPGDSPTRSDLISYVLFVLSLPHSIREHSSQRYWQDGIQVSAPGH